ncbi:MAG: Wzz/FepE/Etk N-terminal domain-containing protein [Planctomycetota bacterium]
MSTATITANDFWNVVFRHKKKIIFLPLVTLLMATAVILWMPRKYRSEARLQLQVGRESVGIDPSATTGQMISLQQTGREAEVASAIDLVGSRGVLTQVVDELGADYVLRGGPAGEVAEPSPVFEAVMTPLKAVIHALKSIDPVSDREEAIIQLEKNLKLESERNSAVIVATIESKSSLGAQTILNKIVDVYKREHLRVHRNPESQDFFLEQRELLEARLEKANREMREAKNRMGLASIAGRRSTLESQLKLVEQESYSTEQNLATSLARVTDLTKQLEVLPERMIASRRSVPNEGADLLRDQLYELQMRQMDLRARYNDSHPLMVAISAQVEEAEKVVQDQSEQREETTDDINPIHRSLALELRQQRNAMAGFEARLTTLREQKELILNDLKQLNAHEVELDDLHREVEIARTKFFKYAENLEQARIDRELEDQKISSVSMAQEPTLQEKPTSPSKVLLGLGGILFAVGGTVTWVTAAEQMSDRLRTSDDIEQQLDLPVLAEIPRSKIHGRMLNY